MITLLKTTLTMNGGASILLYTYRDYIRTNLVLLLYNDDCKRESATRFSIVVLYLYKQTFKVVNGRGGQKGVKYEKRERE